jgi:hypothetical protein
MTDNDPSLVEGRAGGSTVQTLVNEAYVRGRVRIGNLLLLAAMAVFAIGFVLSLNLREEAWLVTYISIFIGLALWQVSLGYLRRWGPRYRMDPVLAQALKGLDDRYTLVSFISPRLPDYLVVGPAGVHVLVPRATGGEIVCRHDRWERANASLLRRLFGAALGNPSQEVVQGVAQVEAYLREHPVEGIEAAVPVHGLVVFTNPRARLRIDGCTVSAVTLKELRGHFKRIKGDLRPQQVSRLRQALERAAQG